MTLTQHHRLAASLATALAAVLTLGLWLPGSKPTGRERPIRRAARSGWSARSVGSAVWVVPDQEVGITTPGASAGDDDAAPDAHAQALSLAVTPGVCPSSSVLVQYVDASPASPRHTARGPHRGRAPPALLS